MNKTEIKELAQDLILQQIPNAYYHVDDDESISQEDRMALDKAIQLQSDRVARLFGYDEQPFTT